MGQGGLSAYQRTGGRPHSRREQSGPARRWGGKVVERTWWTQSVMPQSILSQASTVRSSREVRPAATFSTRKAALWREKSLMSLLDRRLELEPYMTLGGGAPCMQLELLLCVAVSQSRVQRPLISTSGKYWLLGRRQNCISTATDYTASSR